MIREICKDEAFLAQKAEPATADDSELRRIFWIRSLPTRTAASGWRLT